MIRPTTQEWQREKLGSSMPRELRWVSADARRTAKALASFASVFIKVIKGERP